MPDRLLAPRVETAALAAGFTTALRRAGLPVAPDGAVRLARALAVLPPSGRSALYWTCRVVLVSAREQLARFDAVFSAVFDGRFDPAEQRGDPGAPALGATEPRTRPTAPDTRPGVPRDSDASPPAPAAGGGTADPAAPERDALLMLASPEERLHDMSFAELGPEEVARMRELVRRIKLSTPTRRSRRTRPSNRRRDRLSIRHTVRAAQRTGGDSTRLVYASRRPRPRQLVFLCDVSGSMAPFTQVFLALLQGAAAGARAETFVFSTRLTRLTRQLRGRDPDQALARAATSTSDWAGGTRLAESLRRFIDDFGRGGLARGAVVVVLSDGWAHDDPLLVDAQMARLKRLAYRVIWVNPRKAAAHYQPLVGGMAAALPYCDAFVSGHSYAALQELAAAIRSDQVRPSTSQRTRNAT